MSSLKLFFNWNVSIILSFLNCQIILQSVDQDWFWACGTHFKQERILFVVCNVMANALETDCMDIKLLSTHLCSTTQTVNICLDDCFCWKGANCHGSNFLVFLFYFFFFLELWLEYKHWQRNYILFLHILGDWYGYMLLEQKLEYNQSANRSRKSFLKMILQPPC